MSSRESREQAVRALEREHAERAGTLRARLAALSTADAGYAEVGWRRFRRVDRDSWLVLAKLGKDEVPLPVDEIEALLLAAGRAYTHQRRAGRAVVLSVRVGRPGQQDGPGPRPRRKRRRVEPSAERLARLRDRRASLARSLRAVEEQIEALECRVARAGRFGGRRR